MIGLQVDFSVEMDADDPVLEVPWSSPDGRLCYVDLRDHPERLNEIEEARESLELHEFLRRLNAPESAFDTVKCDRWASTEIEPAEEIFGASHKCGSYSDFLFRDEVSRQSFHSHETLVRDLARLLSRESESNATVEFIVRRCLFRENHREGFAITVFATGYGNDESAARQQWGIALARVEAALREAMGRNSRG